MRKSLKKLARRLSKTTKRTGVPDSNILGRDFILDDDEMNTGPPSPTSIPLDGPTPDVASLPRQARKLSMGVVVFHRLPKLKHAKTREEQDLHLQYKLLQCAYLFDFHGTDSANSNSKKAKARRKSPEGVAFDSKTKCLGELVKFLRRMVPVFRFLCLLRVISARMSVFLLQLSKTLGLRHKGVLQIMSMISINLFQRPFPPQGTEGNLRTLRTLENRPFWKEVCAFCVCLCSFIRL